MRPSDRAFAKALRFVVCGDELAFPQEPGSKASATAIQQAEIAASLGLRGACARFFFHEGKMVNALDLPNPVLEQVANAFAACGVELTCLCSPVGKFNIFPQGGQPHARFMTLEEVGKQFDRALEVAGILHIPEIRVFSGYGNDWPGNRAEPSKFADHADAFLRMIADRLASHRGDIVVGVENERYLALWSGQLVLEALERVGSASLFAFYDPGNSQHCGLTAPQIADEAVALVRAKRLLGIHLKEVAKVPGDPAAEPFNESMLAPYHVVPGTGDAGIYEIFRRIAPLLGPNGTCSAMIEGHLNGGGPYGGNSGPRGVRSIIETMSGIWQATGIEWV